MARSPTIPKGWKVPQEDFDIPSLVAFYELAVEKTKKPGMLFEVSLDEALGWGAKVETVVGRVGEQMEHRFSAIDRERLSSEGNEIRWRNTARSSIGDLVNHGFLEDCSAWGVKRLTDKGIATARKAMGL